MAKYDSLGRQDEFDFEPVGSATKPTDQNIPVLKALNWHGPLTTPFLVQFNDSTSDAYTKRRLKELTRESHGSIGGPVLQRPPMQKRFVEARRSKFLIYDYTKYGIKFLKQRGEWEEPIRPGPPLPHQLMTATVSASIQIAAFEVGIEYIPGHRVLAQKNVPLACMVNGTKLIPDQFFVLKWPDGKQRMFYIEADRNTEPITTTKRRKSLENSIAQYMRFVGKKEYKKHFSTKVGMYVLNVFNNSGQMGKFLDLLPDNQFMHCMTIPGFEDEIVPPNIMRELGTGLWLRKGYDANCIHDF